MDVKEAAVMLDRVMPGWADRINTQTLTLHSNERCILGQLFTSYCKGIHALRLLGEITWESGDSPFIQFEDEDKTYGWLIEVMDRTVPAFLPGLELVAA